MSTSLMRSQHVDLLKSDMPNYAVYQRNLAKRPSEMDYLGENSQLSNPIVIDKYGLNINERYNQFSSQVYQNNEFQQSGYGTTFIAEIGNQMPNFDIEYKGTRSLFCRKYRKPFDPIKDQLQELKSQPIQQIKASSQMNQYGQMNGYSHSNLEIPLSSSYVVNNSQVQTRTFPAQYSSINSLPLKQSKYQNMEFQNAYDFKQTENIKNAYSRSFDMGKMNSGLFEQKPICESKIFPSDENKVSNYSRYLLTSGDRKIFTSEDKSYFASKLLYSKPQEIYVKDFTADERLPDKSAYYLQTPNFQNQNNFQTSTEKPEVFVRKQYPLY